jgi:hypothetical protein
MVDHHFVDNTELLEPLRYNLVFSEDTRDIIPLPAPALFNSIARNGYRVMPGDIIAYRNAQAAVEEEPQEWDAQVPPSQHFDVGPHGYYGW